MICDLTTAKIIVDRQVRSTKSKHIISHHTGGL